MTTASWPRYDTARTYDWNYDHAPAPVDVPVPPFPGTWSLCGHSVSSPLGIAAGPLLNGRWILYYASLGFDVLTYKTVRSQPRACYELPNLQPVDAEQLTGDEPAVSAAHLMRDSWAVSFGMPSRSPEIWRADIEATHQQLPRGKLLCVSVVGTIQEGWTIDDLAADYARCALWAVESGADLVEANFSCPNVATCDGQLFQDPASARQVAAALRETIGRVPLVLKIGHIKHDEMAESLLTAVSDYADALAMVNTVATTVRDDGGELMFSGQRRGIAGGAIRDASLTQVRMFADLIHRHGLKTQIIGVGGIATANDVKAHLSAGAGAVHLATAAMLDPAVALKIRRSC